MAVASVPNAEAAPCLPLVIGVGNEHRRDDRSGLDVVRALRSRLEGRARIEECTKDGIALLDLWKGADRVVVVDAVRSGARPGTVLRLVPTDGALHGFGPTTSTHGLSLGEAVALANGLGCLPRNLVVFGIEAWDVKTGTGLSAPVAEGVVVAVARVIEELSSSITPEPEVLLHA